MSECYIVFSGISFYIGGNRQISCLEQLMVSSNMTPLSCILGPNSGERCGGVLFSFKKDSTVGSNHTGLRSWLPRKVYPELTSPWFVHEVCVRPKL